MKMDGPFKLTTQEADSAVWKKLEAQIEKRLAVMRKQNDGDLTDGETNKMRGMIAFAKELLGYVPDKDRG